MDKNNELSGVIIVNKSANMTSRDVVNRLSKILHTKKIGHTGTLDPLATGVLVSNIGRCTKLCDYLTSTFKEYTVTMAIGYETDTLDRLGKVTHTSSKKVTSEEIKRAIKSFETTYLQEVPAYSAVKVNGKRLYDYARSNQSVNLPKREVTISKIDNIFTGEDKITFTALVSKGTYIRSLVRDIGRKLGTYATMLELDRTKQGNFTKEMSYTLEEIEKGNFKIISPEELLGNLPKIECDDELYKKVYNGNPLTLDLTNEYVTFYNKGVLIALYKRCDDKFRMYLKF